MTFDIAQFLSQDGPVARRLDGYEIRPQQVDMAMAVANALDNKERLLVEAGTGVGKSFAYLLPAIRCIVEKKEKVVIATNTIALQEQLMEKDIPLLNAVIPEEFSAVLVKGRSNYVSLRRLKLASERQDRLFPDDATRHSLHQIEDWVYKTEDGSLSTLPMLDRPEVWDFARSDSHNCMGKKCPLNEKCFYQAARRRMDNGDLLVCNHAIFFADLALRMNGVNLLPNYHHVILDEAHGVEDVAADHFGLSLTESRVQFLLRLLYRPNKDKGFLASVDIADDAKQRLGQAIQQVMKCYDMSDAFFGPLQYWFEQNPRANGVIEESGIVHNLLSPAMKELADQLGLLRKKARREADEFELNSYAERARLIAEEAVMIIERKIEDCVYWMELTSSRRYRSQRPRVSLRCAPIEVGPLLREHLFGKEVSVVMTSATLATGQNNFSHIESRLGCEGAKTMQLGSPFDHANQVRLMIDRSMPEPSSREYNDALIPRIMQHVEATDGGAFVLFTSFSMLNDVTDRMRDELIQQDFQVLVHGKDGPRNVLVRRFRENDRSVLFGTASFWQGVDVRGRSLRNVIITKLPFDVPDRPLIAARLQRIKERGGNPFMEDLVPRAVIRFKQGFGRLIRSASDRGRVVVLDPRVVTKRYGSLFLKALPEGVEAEDIQPVSEEW